MEPEEAKGIVWRASERDLRALAAELAMEMLQRPAVAVRADPRPVRIHALLHRSKPTDSPYHMRATRCFECLIYQAQLASH